MKPRDLKKHEFIVYVIKKVLKLNETTLLQKHANLQSHNILYAI